MSRKHYNQTAVLYPQPTATLLTHFDNNYTDECGRAPSRIPVSDLFTTGKFGSAYAPIAGQFLQFDVSDNLIGLQDFTIDFWVYCTSWQTSKSFNWLFSFYADYTYVLDGPFNFRVKSDGNLQFSYRYGGSWHDTDLGVTLTQFVWTHLCVERFDGNLVFFIDGHRVYSMPFDYVSIGNTSVSRLDIGNCYANSANNDRFFRGYIDEFRMIVGTAVWTNDFSPLNVPYAL